MLKDPKCFVAGTPVHTESGQKPIEQIKVGDLVWAFDRQVSEWRLCSVTRKFERQSNLITSLSLADGTELTGTDRHPFWVIEGEDLAARPTGDHGSDEIPGRTPGRWVAMRALRAGDAVLARHGRVTRVVEVNTRSESVPVYNMTVAGLHSYAVGNSGVLVHNGGKVYDESISRLAKTKPDIPEKPTVAVQKNRKPETTPAGGAHAKAVEAPAAKAVKPETAAATREKWRRDRVKTADIPPANRAVVDRQQTIHMDDADRAATRAAFARREAAQKTGINETKKAAGREVGTVGAERYMAKNRKTATKVYQDATPNGNGTFDYVYKEGDQFIVVEAKGLGGRRRTRNAGTKADPIHLQQGSRPYFNDILKTMKVGTSEQKRIAEELEVALLTSGKVTYMEVATKKSGLKKKWFTITNFSM